MLKMSSFQISFECNFFGGNSKECEFPVKELKNKIISCQLVKYGPPILGDINSPED